MAQVDANTLKTFIERIEVLESEKKEISEDIKSVYEEADVNGFNKKILKSIVRIRKEDPDKREEFEHQLDLYLNALGLK